MTSDYTLQTKAWHVEQEDLQRYKSDRNKVTSDLLLHLSESTSNAGMGIVIHIAFCLFFIIIFSIFCYLITKWDPQPHIKDEYYDTIGGWLVLPVIHLGYALAMSLWKLYTTGTHVNAYFKLVQLSGTSVLSMDKITILILEVLYVPAFICFSITLLILFFKKRTSVPILIIIFYVLTFSSVMTDLVVIGTLGDDLAFEGDFQKKINTSVFRVVIACAIWIPYFLLSKRVAGTFINRRKGNVPPEIPSLPPPIPQSAHERNS
ncbi:MAG: DUF2569 domain-containing protein [Bacteroidota bacterium]|nr:DUF2569 domain-containing protein [Bacteroidota bacterium]